MTIQHALQIAFRHHQSDQLAEAEAIYRRILAAQPDNAQALHLLGVIAHQANQNDAAVDLITKAIAIAPGEPDFHSNIGEAYRGLGRTEEAIAAFRRAIALKPNSPTIHSNLGVALAVQGRYDDAISALRQAITLHPKYGRAYYNLGKTWYAKWQLDEAIAAFRQAIVLEPNFPEAYNDLGAALGAKNCTDEAIAVLRHAISLKPNYPEAYGNVGMALADKGQPDEAIAAFQQAIALEPNAPEAYNSLGSALKDRGQLDEAIAAYRQAIRLKPDDSDMCSNVLYTLHFHPSHNPGSIREEHRAWFRQFGEPLRKFHRPHANERDPERPLRVGYVSPDFSRHVICHFLTPLLEAHDPAGFELFCYASVKRPDWVTARLRKTAAVWRDVLGVPDEALAERIREDRIDILVDLTQHMGDNRLLMFARKPAPVQVAWLGYPASTGLPAMDYRLTDAGMEPEGSSWSESVEMPVRLRDSWFCFDPIDDYPDPGPLPAPRAGHVTFGSLNNFCKTNDAVFQLWVLLLQAIEGSRLLLQCPAGTTQARVRQWFESRGIAGRRIELVSKIASRAEFLQLFGRIDIALEAFPYNGGTTTCEALWMGVPVPTFPGSTAMSRIGLSILTAAGLQEWIAASQDDYVRLMAGLAGDLPRLAKVRSSLRQRMKASAFMDSPRFARNVEHAFRQMWRAWCAGQTSPRQ